MDLSIQANWAANLAAGASYGYELLWVVTLSTIMLILLQHNVAHLGIVRGQCLSECAYEFLPRYASRFVLSTAGIAAAATALAEFIGAAIALKMLFGIPILIGSILTALICTVMLITNSYRKLERIIAGFVSLIALAYLVEVNMVNVDWVAAGIGWVDPNIPNTSMLVILSILGAVIMPHNLFLHSEIIQSRQFNTQDPAIMKRQLRYEFLDTLLSMGIGWMINSAMIILAAAVFFAHGIEVTELEQAEELLRPLIGSAAGIIFRNSIVICRFCLIRYGRYGGGKYLCRNVWRVLRYERLPYAIRLGTNICSSIIVDRVYYRFLPSIIVLSNVLELAITNHHLLATLHDE